jgi:two-component system cell cycle sensor histidine kinase/response regulator CckA
MFTDTWPRPAGEMPRVAPRARVLIVDDEAPVCAFVNRILRDGGYRTEVAYSGPAAIELVEATGPFDLLLTDVNMPHLSGHALAAHLRRRDPRIKVLYLTGYSDLLFNDKGTLWEDEAFVDKPTSGRGLLEAVALLLTGHVDA